MEETRQRGMEPAVKEIIMFVVAIHKTSTAYTVYFYIMLKH